MGGVEAAADVVEERMVTNGRVFVADVVHERILAEKRVVGGAAFLTYRSRRRQTGDGEECKND